MSAEIYKCTYCQYQTLKKYNLYRHMVAKHKNNNCNFVSNNCNFVSNDCICNKCNKTLSSKYYLKKHIENCKGNIDSLTCPNCLKIFKHRSSKYTHLKKCKSNTNSLIINNNTSNILIFNDNKINNIITTNNNIYINNSNINNNNINNNNTNNINLIIYDKENDKLNFDISHLNFNFLAKLNYINMNESFKYYCEKLFENKNNQMIIKTSLKNKYSKIHIGLNIWENFLDQCIYPKLMTIISESMISYIEKYKTDNTYLKKLIDYLEIMAGDGYAYNDTIFFKKQYKNNIDMLKILFNSFM